jgi:hypothetical protein
MPAALVESLSSKEEGLRPAYRVSELLALRSSVSDDIVPFEKFGSEDAIKGTLEFIISFACLVSRTNVNVQNTSFAHLHLVSSV